MERVLFFDPLAKKAPKAVSFVEQAAPTFMPPQLPRWDLSLRREQEVQQLIQELAVLAAETPQQAAQGLTTRPA